MLYTQTVEPATLELLKKLLAIDALNNFALVGGTNLSLRYGHRMSIDIDLFINEDFDLEFVDKIIQSTFKNVTVEYKKGQTLLYKIDNIKVDLVQHKYPYLKNIEIIDNIRMLSVEDVIPMKLNALAGRGAKKDFCDIAILLDYFSLPEMLDLFSKRYNNYDIGFVVHSLYYFADAEPQDDPLFLIKNSWQTIKSKIKKHADKYTDSQSK